MDQLERFTCPNVGWGKDFVVHLSLLTSWANVLLGDIELWEVLDVFSCFSQYIIRWMRQSTVYDFIVNTVDGTYLSAISSSFESPFDIYGVILGSRVEGEEIVFSFT